MFCSQNDQIKHMGHRIELGEIEQAINALDYIQASFVATTWMKKEYTYISAEEGPSAAS